MANQEHLEILKKGLPAWDRWRMLNPGIKPDLGGANLSAADLIGANLGAANLHTANLSGAKLSKANLTGANVSEAKLGAADLSEAKLRKANLGGAKLSEANLSGANLSKANLGGANLGRADLIGTNLGEANLGEANLSEANLSKAHLGRANLGGANLIGANLSEGGLIKANLIGANLGAANLHTANLSGTNLSKANLGGANLGGADLIGADLIGTNLGGANLTGANLADSVMGDTSIGDIDLSGMKGLETVRHLVPSSIGIDTIVRSQGNIPEIFLRGAGVPEPFIVQMKALVAAIEPIQFYSCFISHSSKNTDFAERLYADLQGKGVRCWFAPHDIQAGKKVHEQIDIAIHVHDRLLLILSLDSMNSEWVKTEIAEARKREAQQKRKVLFPLRLVPFELIQDWKCFDADMGKDSAREIREYFIPDFSNWKNHDAYQKAFEQLMRDLKAEDSPNDKVHRSGDPSK